MKKIYILLLAIQFTMFAWAQNISVQAPSTVNKGENFRLSYTMNTQDVSQFRLGNIPEGLELITGPYESRSSSYVNINGHNSVSSSLTKTYILYANKTGKYTIPSATATVNGHSAKSNAVTITVSGSASNTSSQRQSAPQMHSDENADFQAQGTKISGSDLYVTATPNKKHVYEQEPVLVTYKVYSQVDLIQFGGKMPEMNGFHSEEIELPQQKSFKVETVNGKPYKTVTWSEYVIFPQMTGKLEIPSVEFEGTIGQRVMNVDPMEAFFNGGSSYVEIPKKVKAPAVTIQVDPLPDKPTGFSGGVGRFNITSSIENTTIKAGEAATLNVEITGTGNLKFIKQPVVEFPNDFDTYDAKVDEQAKLTTEGSDGTMKYEFLFVPKNPGTYTIPAVIFTYFDIDSKQYKTIKTEPVTVNVTPTDAKSSVSSFQKDNDIHEIMRGDAELQHKGSFVFCGKTYLYGVVIPLLIFIILVVIFRKRAIDNANIIRMRGKKANKVATKRLRTASKLMAKGQQNEFYDEVLRALWGYVGDKLNIPASELSRDNIADRLSTKDIDNETIETFIEAIDECEYARFAPGDPQGKMDIVYGKAEKAISDIDNMLNQKKKNKVMPKATVLLILMFSVVLNANAYSKKQADAEYEKHNYQEAITQYNNLLKQGVSTEIYYNLGNAYFRTGEITKAIIAYERALKLSPGNSDVKFNLQFARNKTIDKITPKTEMFFVTWYKQIVNFTSSDNWTKTSIVFFIWMLIFAGLYLFGPGYKTVRIGFYCSVVCLVLFICTTFLAWQQKGVAETHDGAVVVAAEVSVKKTPSKEGTEAMKLHEGTHVDITDRGIKGWKQVILADGRKGWVEDASIEEI